MPSNRTRDTNVSVSEARQSFADLVNRVAYAGVRIVVHRHGRDIAAIIPMSDLRELGARADVVETAGPSSDSSSVRPRRPGPAAPRR